MITGLDHVTLICPDLSEGVAAYTQIMGRGPAWLAAQTGDGTATAIFRVGNTALELMAPQGDGPVGDRIRTLLDDTGPGIASIAFATSDIDETHRVLARRGLAPSEISDGQSSDQLTGEALTWRRFRCSDDALAALRVFVISERTARLPIPESAEGGVTSLDHFVIGTPNTARAAANYGARFGLRLALDRAEPRWNTHFLFFRTGGLTLEIVRRLDDASDLDGPDRYYGMTWETADIRAAHARLEAAGLDVSEVRKGRKPGSEVFTLRDGTLGVPTLFIAHGPR